MDHFPQVLLCGPEIAEVAASLELMLRDRRRNGRVAGAETRQLAAKVARAIPLYSVTFPALLDAAGPEASAAVRAQAAAAVGSAACPRPVLLGCSEASRAAGVSARAIRASAQAGRLRAVKHKHTNEWRISVDDLQAWMANRVA